MKYRLLTICCCAALVACQAPNTDSAQATTPGIENYTNLFTDQLPSDIAVMQVVDKTATQMAPTKQVRKAVRAYFLKRGYSPLSPDYLDNKFEATSASSLGLARTGGVEVLVYSWDETRAYSAGTLRFDVEISIYGDNGAVLFNARHHAKVQLAAGQMGSIMVGRRANRLIGQMVSGLLVKLPAPPPM